MDERRHQYMLDLEGLGGEADPTWKKVDNHDGGSPLGLHDTTLFDQPESIAGDLVDEATGLPYQTPPLPKLSGGLEVVDDLFGEDSVPIGYDRALSAELDELEARLGKKDVA